MKKIIVELAGTKDYYDSDLILLRGQPGAGKSHFAAHLQQKGAEHKGVRFSIAEADQYFCTGKDGEYIFVPTELNRAYAHCFNRVEEKLKAGEKVIVANCFTYLADLRQYLDLANSLQKKVSILRVFGYNKCTKPMVKDYTIIRNIQEYQPYSEANYSAFIQATKIPASAEKLKALVESPLNSGN